MVRPAHIDGMTMQTLPVSGGAAAPDAPELTSRWERFENAGRDRATRAGRPVPRLAMPGALPMQAPSADGTHSGPPVVLLVTGRGGNLRVRELTTQEVGGPVDLDAAMLADRFLPAEDPTDTNRTPEGGRIVVPDRATLRSLLDHLDPAADGHLMRAVEIASSLPASTRVVVLTEALDRKFFLPHGLDAGDLGAWASAFGLGKPRSVSNLPVLYRAACWADEGGTPGNVGEMAARDEARLMCGAAYTGVAQQCALFERADRVAAAHTFMAAADPLGRERARVDGTVFDVTWVEGNLVSVQGGFTAKEGKQLLGLPPECFPQMSTSASATLTLKEIRAEDGGFVMEVQPNRVMRAWLREQDTVSVIASPYLFGGGGMPGPRWTVRPGHPEAPRKLVRDVPLSVSFAGAPVEGAAA